MFTAYGPCGFIVPRYFAAIMDKARAVGNLAGGYNQVYFTLALFAVAGAVDSLIPCLFTCRCRDGPEVRRTGGIDRE